MTDFDTVDSAMRLLRRKGRSIHYIEIESGLP